MLGSLQRVLKAQRQGHQRHTDKALLQQAPCRAHHGQVEYLHFRHNPLIAHLSGPVTDIQYGVHINAVAKVRRADIERGHLRHRMAHGHAPLFAGQRGFAPRGALHHNIALRTDEADGFIINAQVFGQIALVVPNVQVNHGRTGPGAVDYVPCHAFGRQPALAPLRQIVRHRRHSQNDGFCHTFILSDPCNSALRRYRGEVCYREECLPPC